MKANTKVAVGRASGNNLSLPLIHEEIHEASLWYKEFSRVDSFIPYTEGDTLWWSVETDWVSFSFKYKGNQRFSVSINGVNDLTTFVLITFEVPLLDTYACSTLAKVDMVFPFKAPLGKAHFIYKMEMCLAWDFMVRTEYLPLLRRTRNFKRVSEQLQLF